MRSLLLLFTADKNKCLINTQEIGREKYNMNLLRGFPYLRTIANH